MIRGAAFADKALYSHDGVFYPRGHVFAMFSDGASAHAAADAVCRVSGVGAVENVSSTAIVARMGEDSEQSVGMPSVGREDQFMRRFVELARAGMVGLLVEVDTAKPQAIATALQSPGVELAYHYRALVIEELLQASTRADAAAAGRL